MMSFLYYYIRSMRLYYCFVTGAATLTGVVLATASPRVSWSWQASVILLIGFLAWGVNQVINDYFDRKEDDINAPRRPMVTGKLSAKPAFFFSIGMMLIFGAVAYIITPWTLLPISIGFLCNVFYGFTKGIVLLGNVLYAVSISMCTLFGYIGARGGVHDQRDIYAVLTLCGFLALSHVLMCLYSTLKDVEGDRVAGKKTFAVVIGEQKTQVVCGIFALVLLMLYFVPVFLVWPDASMFIIAWGWCAFLVAWNVALYAKKQLHRATKSNCQSCTAQQLLIISLYTPWGLVIMLIAWLSIELVFRWYPDEKE